MPSLPRYSGYMLCLHCTTMAARRHLDSSQNQLPKRPSHSTDRHGSRERWSTGADESAAGRSLSFACKAAAGERTSCLLALSPLVAVWRITCFFSRRGACSCACGQCHRPHRRPGRRCLPMPASRTQARSRIVSQIICCKRKNTVK